jgi:SAM-dependent methyltransferase
MGEETTEPERSTESAGAAPPVDDDAAAGVEATDKAEATDDDGPEAPVEDESATEDESVTADESSTEEESASEDEPATEDEPAIEEASATEEASAIEDAADAPAADEPAAEAAAVGIPVDAQPDTPSLDAVLWEPLADAALLRAQPRFDELVLDAWCGTGAAALPTAALVGPAGRVDAIDPDESLVAVARERAGQTLPQLHLEVADPATWATSGYDLVQCVLGLALCDTPDDTARHLVSLAKPGGRVVLSLWAQGAFAPLETLAREALAAEQGTADSADDTRPAGDADDSGEASAHDLPGTPGTLATLLHQLELVDVRAERVDRHVALDGETAWRLVAAAGRVPVDELDAATLSRVRERFVAAVAAHDLSRVDVSTVIAVGHRPA